MANGTNCIELVSILTTGVTNEKLFVTLVDQILCCVCTVISRTKESQSSIMLYIFTHTVGLCILFFKGDFNFCSVLYSLYLTKLLFLES
jgi:hypothetical protein